MDNRNLYFSDINNNVENKVFYNNEYKPTVMPSQTKQSIKKIGRASCRERVSSPV